MRLEIDLNDLADEDDKRDAQDPDQDVSDEVDAPDPDDALTEIDSMAPRKGDGGLLASPDVIDLNNLPDEDQEYDVQDPNPDGKYSDDDKDLWAIQVESAQLEQVEVDFDLSE